MSSCDVCGGPAQGGATMCPKCVYKMQVRSSAAALQPSAQAEAPRAEPVVKQSRAAAATPVGAARKGRVGRFWYSEPEEDPDPEAPMLMPESLGEPWEAAPAPMTEPDPPPPVPKSGLTMHMDHRFEWHSLPKGEEAVAHLLIAMRPYGIPLADLIQGADGHLILALDLSASMNTPEKYPVLMEALRRLIASLKARRKRDQRLSIVLFAYGSEILCRNVSVQKLSADAIVNAIDRSKLRFTRYTDVAGALNRAGRLAYDSHMARKARPIRICLLTDGKPQDQQGALKVMERLSKIPCDIQALAFGADADVESLQALVSGRPGGTVKHVRSENLGETFERMADVMQNVVSKRSPLQLALHAGVVGGRAYRFRPGRFSYGQEAFRGGRLFTTDLGTLETGRAYSLLFQLRIPASQAVDTDIGIITLRVPGIGGPRTFKYSLSMPRHSGTSKPEPERTVVAARDVLESLEDDETASELKALRARRELYVSERRDPYLIKVIDRAIAELESTGSTDSLTRSERAALMSHTRTVCLGAPSGPGE